MIVLILILAGLVIGNRSGRHPRPAASRPTAATDSGGSVPNSGRAAARPAPVPAPAPAGSIADRTPVIARMARAEARRRLSWAGPAVYLDSLFVSPDSVIRRWNDRAAVRVVISPAGPPGAIGEVRAAIGVWREVGFGVAVVETTDSAMADVAVRWVDRFEAGQAERTGLTEIQSNAAGEIERATVWLALGEARGRLLAGSEIRGIALHELGHALGLPHSAGQGDIMYPTVRRAELSARDRSSIALLYALAPGPLREPSSP